jgi:hypothetical protein
VNFLKTGAAVVVSTLLATTAATAGTPGYAACMAKSSAISKMFYALPVAAEEGKTDAMALQYVQMLRDEKYAAKSIYAPADAGPPAIEADCRWYATSAEAKAWTDKVIQGAAGRGYAVLGTPFTPR